MALSAHQHLGPDEVVAKIGEAGWEKGTKRGSRSLAAVVAIKVAPKPLAVSGPERRNPVRKIGIDKKVQSNSQPSRYHFRKRQPLVLFLMIYLACAVSNAETSRLYPPSKDEAGALRLAQVMQTATREEILKLTTQREHLLASGLQDSDFKDGSLAVGRVYCCHPSTDEGTAMWFYVPPDKPVNPGDIVEIRMGREPTKTDPGKVNMLIEIRQKKDSTESHCSWDPPQDFLWRRVLYCDWMPTEGWTLKKGSHNTWLKRAPDATVQ